MKRFTMKGALALLFFVLSMALIWVCVDKTTHDDIPPEAYAIIGGLIGSLMTITGQIVSSYFPTGGSGEGRGGNGDRDPPSAAA